MASSTTPGSVTATKCLRSRPPYHARSVILRPGRPPGAVVSTVPPDFELTTSGSDSAPPRPSRADCCGSGFPVTVTARAAVRDHTSGASEDPPMPPITLPSLPPAAAPRGARPAGDHLPGCLREVRQPSRCSASGLGRPYPHRWRPCPPAGPKGRPPRPLGHLAGSLGEPVVAAAPIDLHRRIPSARGGRAVAGGLVAPPAASARHLQRRGDLRDHLAQESSNSWTPPSSASHDVS